MTSAIPVQRSNQLSYQANWELVNLHIIPSLSAVQIYDYFIYIHVLNYCIAVTHGQ